MNDLSLPWAHFVADGRPGGGTTLVLGLIDELMRLGAAAPTLISQPDSYLAGQAQVRGLPFVGIDLFRGGLNPFMVGRVLSALGEQRFALTHVHGLRAAHTAVAAPVRARLGRLIYTVHGLHQLHLPAPVRALANMADRRAMRRVDATVFVSHADQALALQHRLAAAPQQVIYNGIDLSALRPLPAAQRDIDVAFIGRLVEQKNPERAARALAALAAQGQRCVLAGGGPLQPSVAAVLAAASAPVQCLGELGHEQALALLARTRVLLMPSRWEGLPILPMEAAALGVPVVATALPGTAEVVEHLRTGCLVQEAEPASAAAAPEVEAARHLLADTAAWQAMSEAGPPRAQRLFDRRACAAAYNALYRSVLRSSGAAP